MKQKKCIYMLIFISLGFLILLSISASVPVGARQNMFALALVLQCIVGVIAWSCLYQQPLQLYSWKEVPCKVPFVLVDTFTKEAKPAGKVKAYEYYYVIALGKLHYTIKTSHEIPFPRSDTNVYKKLSEKCVIKSNKAIN